MTLNLGQWIVYILKILISKLGSPATPTAPVEVAAPSAPTAPAAPIVTPPATKPPALAPVVTPLPVVSNQATAEKLIASQTMNDGPMPGTGGVIHKLNAAEIETIAALVLAFCGKYPKLSIPLMFAWIRAESDFDPAAVDPNEENWPKNPTANDKLVNQDVGLAQFSWATLVAMPDFAGMSNDEIMTQALDGEWSCGAMFAFCDNLRQQAEAAVLADPSLLARIPNRDVTYLYVQAYNSGFAGAVDMARASGLAGDWSYAAGIISDRNAWAKLFV